jgi:hypothetical protein
MHAGYLNLQTHTLRICNTYCFSTATVATRTRLNVTFIRPLFVFCLLHKRLQTLISATWWWFWSLSSQRSTTKSLQQATFPNTLWANFPLSLKYFKQDQVTFRSGLPNMHCTLIFHTPVNNSTSRWQNNPLKTHTAHHSPSLVVKYISNTNLRDRVEQIWKYIWRKMWRNKKYIECVTWCFELGTWCWQQRNKVQYFMHEK